MKDVVIITVKFSIGEVMALGVMAGAACILCKYAIKKIREKLA